MGPTQRPSSLRENQMTSSQAFAILLASALPTVCHRPFQRKGHAVNTPIQTSEQLTEATRAEAVAPEIDELAQSSFTAEEIAALCWLRGWYQSGGSDRMELVRSWEFLKWLVTTGRSPFARGHPLWGPASDDRAPSHSHVL